MDTHSLVDFALLLQNFADKKLLSRMFETFDYIELVQKPLQSVVLEQARILHLLLYVRQVDQGDELNEQLAFEALFRRNKGAPHVEPLLEVAESLLHQILVAVELESRGGVHGLVGQESEKAEIALPFGDRLRLDGNLGASFRGGRDIEVPAVSGLVLRNPFARLEFVPEGDQPAVEGLLLLGRPVDVVVVMHIDAPWLRDSIPLVRTVLPVVPFGLQRMAVQLVRVVEAVVGAELFVQRLQVLLDKGKGHPARDDEFDMLLEEGVDVVLAVKASVHDQLDFGVPENVQLRKKSLHRLDVWNVSGQLAVVEGETRGLAEDQGQIQLGQTVVLLVLAVLNLPEIFRVAGDGGDVVSPEFVVHPSSSLKPEKLVLRFLADGREEFAASLGADVLPAGMLVQSAPLLEAVERVLVLQNQVVCYGQDLLEGLRKAPLQVFGDAEFLADGVEEKGCSVEKPCCLCDRNRSWFCRELIVPFLSPSSVGGDDLAGPFVESADQGSLGSGLSFFPVPVGYGFVGVGDPGAFVLLEDDACHSPTSSLRI